MYGYGRGDRRVHNGPSRMEQEHSSRESHSGRAPYEDRHTANTPFRDRSPRDHSTRHTNVNSARIDILPYPVGGRGDLIPTGAGRGSSGLRGVYEGSLDTTSMHRPGAGYLSGDAPPSHRRDPSPVPSKRTIGPAPLQSKTSRGTASSTTSTTTEIEMIDGMGDVLKTAIKAGLQEEHPSLVAINSHGGLNKESNTEFLKSCEHSSVISEDHDTLHYLMFLIAHGLVPNVKLAPDEQVRAGASYLSDIPIKPPRSQIDSILEVASTVYPTMDVDTVKIFMEVFPALVQPLSNLVTHKSITPLAKQSPIDDLIDVLVDKLPLHLVEDISGSNAGGLEMNRKQMRNPKLSKSQCALKSHDRVSSMLAYLRKATYTNVNRVVVEELDVFADRIRELRELDVKITRLRVDTVERNNVLQVLSKHESLMRAIRLSDDSLLRNSSPEIRRQQCIKNSEIELLSQKEEELKKSYISTVEAMQSTLSVFDREVGEVDISQL